MFSTNYYCLVAGLREYGLDGEVKGFDPRQIIDQILEELTDADAAQVRLLYTYYDCENLAALREGRAAHNPLGNLSPEQLEEQLREPRLLPSALARVVRAYGDPEGEDAELVDLSLRFEASLFGAYFATCERASSRFLRGWSDFDRTLRNLCAAISARGLSRSVDQVTVGGGDLVEQLQRSSAADFGLRGELPYVDAVIAAVNDQTNLLEKEHKIDLIRWREATELAISDYFDINAVLSYLVRVNLVARWSQLDATRGAEMFARLREELGGKELINK